jgi:hypothetical protein
MHLGIKMQCNSGSRMVARAQDVVVVLEEVV